MQRRRRNVSLMHKSSNVLASKKYFTLKGRLAEEFLHQLAEKTFLEDWCYKNPLLPDGKELCDLLVVFDNIAIIWQLKNVKLDEDGNFKKSDIEKNLRQLSGSRRKLVDLKCKVTLVNPRRGEEIFDPSIIKEVFLISALFAEEPFTLHFTANTSGHFVHVFTKRFTEIVLNELDTISDFCKYLRTKQDVLSGNTSCIITGGEEELLAHYLRNNRSFDKLRNYDFVHIDTGDWTKFQTNKQYLGKKKEDEFSYLWDGIISRSHEGDSPEYELIARELAKCDRFQRRILSKAFLEAHTISHKTNRTFRRFFLGEDAVYCFLFQDDPEPRNNRKSHIASMCHVARGRYKDKKVIGIATEKSMEATCSYDFVLFNVHKWTDEDQKLLDKIEAKKDILWNPHKKVVHEDEYPTTETKYGIEN